MAGGDDKKKEISKIIKEMSNQILYHKRQIEELVKLSEGDKDLAKMAKALSDAHPPVVKAARAILDSVK